MSITRNTTLLRREVDRHIALDAVAQGAYWSNGKGCFIGCLGHGVDLGRKTHFGSCEMTLRVAQRFGLSFPLQRLAEQIFEGLPPHEARKFFRDFPDAVQCDGKDLSLVPLQFLAAELHELLRIGDRLGPLHHLANLVDTLQSGCSADQAQRMQLMSLGASLRDFQVADTDPLRRVKTAALCAVECLATLINGADTPVARYFAYPAFASEIAWATSFAEAGSYQRVVRRQRDLLLRLIKEAPIAPAVMEAAASQLDSQIQVHSPVYTALPCFMP